jgi:hypothetical protein
VLARLPSKGNLCCPDLGSKSGLNDDGPMSLGKALLSIRANYIMSTIGNRRDLLVLGKPGYSVSDTKAT